MLDFLTLTLVIVSMVLMIFSFLMIDDKVAEENPVFSDTWLGKIPGRFWMWLFVSSLTAVVVLLQLAGLLEINLIENIQEAKEVIDGQE